MVLTGTSHAAVKGYNSTYSADFSTHNLDANGYVSSGNLSSDQYIYYDYSAAAYVKTGTLVYFRKFSASSSIHESFLWKGKLSGNQSLPVYTGQPLVQFKDNTAIEFNSTKAVLGTLNVNTTMSYGYAGDDGPREVTLKAGTVVNITNTYGYSTTGNVGSGTLYGAQTLFYGPWRTVGVAANSPVTFSNRKLYTGIANGTQSVLYGPGRYVSLAGYSTMHFYYVGYLVNDWYISKGTLAITQTLETNTGTGTSAPFLYVVDGGYTPPPVLHFTSLYGGCVYTP